MSDENNESDATSAIATPEEHAQATGNVIALKGRRTINGVGLGDTFTVAHGAAAQLHGWTAHKLATTEPLKISRESYELALIAATEGGDPIEEALSPFAPQFEAREPKQLTAKRKGRR